MKPTLRRSSRYLAIAAAALAVTFGAAYAAGDNMPPAGPDAPAMPGGPGGWHGHGAFMMERLNALHARLALTPEQEQKWQTALATMKQSREAERANHDKMRQQFKAAQQQSILDLDALHAAHQQVRQQDEQLHEQTATAWLAFYDGLNDQQKTTVSTELKQHFAKMESRHEKMREFWQKHRGTGTRPDASRPTPP